MRIRKLNIRGAEKFKPVVAESEAYAVWPIVDHKARFIELATQLIGEPYNRSKHRFRVLAIITQSTFLQPSEFEKLPIEGRVGYLEYAVETLDLFTEFGNLKYWTGRLGKLGGMDEKTLEKKIDAGEIRLHPTSVRKARNKRYSFNKSDLQVHAPEYFTKMKPEKTGS